MLSRKIVIGVRFIFAVTMTTDGMINDDFSATWFTCFGFESHDFDRLEEVGCSSPKARRLIFHVARAL